MLASETDGAPHCWNCFQSMTPLPECDFLFECRPCEENDGVYDDIDREFYTDGGGDA